MNNKPKTTAEEMVENIHEIVGKARKGDRKAQSDFARIYRLVTRIAETENCFKFLRP